MNILEKLDYLIEEKKKKINTKEEQEKMNLLLELLSVEGCFFKIPRNTVIGMLEFLDVKQDEIESFYKELISPEMFVATTPQDRILIER